MSPIRAWAAALLLAAIAPGARAAAEIEPGAYCPFPEPGQRPKCLEPARAEYGEFFEALDDDELDDAKSARLEADLSAGAAAGNAYLALSSLTYGYYRLAQRVTSDPEQDPALVARLERWNALLSRAFDASANQPGFRKAVREAAVDLHRRGPAVRLRCADADGQPAECSSTEAVIRGIDAADDRVGYRGALGRLLQRITGGSSE
jgi:hypothetical protein